MNFLGMNFDLSDPVTQTAIMPLFVGFVVAGILRLVGGESRGPVLAVLSVVAAFLGAYVLILGTPPWPPRGAIQKIAYVALIGGAVGLVFDLFPKLRAQSGLAALAGVAAILIWLAWSRLGDFGLNRESASALAVAASGLILLVRLGGKVGEAQTAGVLSLVYALGAGAVALIGNSASLAQLCFAAGAGIGGFMLWNWPIARFPFGFTAIFGVVGALVAMAVQMAIFTRASVPALLVLTLVPFADLAARPFQISGGVFGRALQPVFVGIAAAIVAGAAVGMASFLDHQP